MTAPQGAIEPIAAILFPVTNTGIVDRYGLDQPTAEAALKLLHVQENPAITNPLDDIFTSLRKGPIARAIIEVLSNRLFGGLNVFPTTQDAIMAIKQVPGLGDLIEFFTGQEDGDLNDLGTIGLNFRAALGNFNFLDPNFNPLNFAQNFLDNVLPQIGIPKIIGLEAVLTEHTEAIASLETTAAATRTTAAYVGDIQDMVSAPRSLLVGMGSSKSHSAISSMSCADNSHAHGRNSLPTIKPERVAFNTQGTIYYAPIVVDRFGTVDKLRWIVGADESIFSIDYYEMALCIYNPVNGNVEKVWTSGDIKAGAASTTTLAEVELAMGIDQECIPGQLLFVAHQQVAPGVLQDTRTFAAVPQANIARPSSLLVNAASYTAPTYSQGIPSSIALSALTTENRYIPWVGVSVVSE